ncbi:aminoglycoside phosphotransferase [Agromyces badenianii]|uniref:Aminoglycoside phosphotransferase n=1 Tax=Agromyces badenianii TaxID=2080742 RepID=A0A2S0WSP3_9MICO|nr:phosphotransferase [Agromyces badenianii]AWB94349.1 aminoglycoside phosphotransferase [Agromyces badenianii]
MAAREQLRLRWDALPRAVRDGIEKVLGGDVVEARSQPSGFSSGSADRVRTRHGRRAFVKAAHIGHNAGTVALHRRELAFMSEMPPFVPAPRLLGTYERDGWIALVFEDIVGTHPGAALDGSDVPLVLNALHALPRVRGNISIPLFEVANEVAADGGSWDEIVRDDALASLPKWAQMNLERLAVASRRAGAAVAGDHLVHFDCRADNMLIDTDGQVWIIDWPWAAVGARWFDGLTYLLDARLRGEAIDAEAVITSHPMFGDVAPEDIDAALAATTGAFFNTARRPAPDSMPTLRAFQRSEALAGMEWLRERWA